MRRHGDMINIMVFQLFHSGINVDPTEFFKLAPPSATRGHSLKLQKLHAVTRSDVTCLESVSSVDQAVSSAHSLAYWWHHWAWPHWAPFFWENSWLLDGFWCYSMHWFWILPYKSQILISLAHTSHLYVFKIVKIIHFPKFVFFIWYLHCFEINIYQFHQHNVDSSPPGGL